MDPLSPLPSLIIVLIAMVCAFCIVRTVGAPPVQDRFATIDGLRGYLAFFVFLHHASVWFFYLHEDKWLVPNSNMYTHFGQSAVALFFMITGFLFFSKLLRGRRDGVDWLKLFVSRVLRLTPLYLSVLGLMFVVVGFLSGWQLRVAPYELAKEMLKWATFTVFGAPSLNGMQNAWTVVAGVTWSLPYEWKFYLILPLFGLVLGVVSPWIYIALGLLTTWYFQIWQPSIHYVSFAGGIVAALSVRSERLCAFASTPAGSAVAMICIGGILFFPTAYSWVPLMLLTSFFVLVAAGSNLFGLLSLALSRALGELSYGIYLLHGITLFIFFNFVLGLQKAKALSTVDYWLWIGALTPFLILLCFFAFRWIEFPCMQKTTALTARIRCLVKRI